MQQTAWKAVLIVADCAEADQAGAVGTTEADQAGAVGTTADRDINYNRAVGTASAINTDRINIAIYTDGINIAINTDGIRMAYAIGYYVILPSGQHVLGKYDATNCLEGSTYSSRLRRSRSGWRCRYNSRSGLLRFGAKHGKISVVYNLWLICHVDYFSDKSKQI